MNTQTRLVLGIAGGFVIGALFVGSAVAIPRLFAAMHSGARSAYSMMTGDSRSTGYGQSYIEDWNGFTDSYRSSEGSVDRDRAQYDRARDGSYADGSCNSGVQAGRSSYRGQDDGYGYREGYGMMGWGY